MSPKGRGCKKTPERVIGLLQKEVTRTSQAATARATGLTLQTVQRYIQGIGEPTTATLEKLAAYFGVSVAWLRGEAPDTDLFKNYAWHAGYDMWAITLSSVEVVLSDALQSRESILKDNQLLTTAIDTAAKILNMSDEVVKLFHPEHLKEVQELAREVLSCFKADLNP